MPRSTRNCKRYVCVFNIMYIFILYKEYISVSEVYIYDYILYSDTHLVHTYSCTFAFIFRHVM